ncbi:NlpC/P60 family protein [Lentzea sp. NPDC005914]|uniref:NlpC/P60 family protein n=1 Tax=Lentzea sp. NPDC005914 TaxID=3154572 RepID=UPI0033E1BB0F
MTAIALAESRGQSGARNAEGEDSRGLWQINVQAHTDRVSQDLYDPAVNAKAAFEVSQGGTDISPWTTTHGGLSARYLRFRDDAQAAAVAYGDGPGLGMWSGTSGYGDPTSAGRSDGRETPSDEGSATVTGQSAHVTSNTSAVTGVGEEYGIPLDVAAPAVDGVTRSSDTPTGTGAEYGIPLDGQLAPAQQPASSARPNKTQEFLDTALAQTGDQYIYGAEVELDDPDPSAFDCSELVQWAGHRVGVEIPDGVIYQYRHLREHLIPVEQAINTPGALLFSFSSDPEGAEPSGAHVAISLGDGKTIEAMGTEYGVGSWAATTARFQYAAVIPGISDLPVPSAAPPPAAAPSDPFAHRVETDPAAMDTDPTVLEASRQLTAAEPPSAQEVANDLPEGNIGDVDHDGVDDALASATSWADFADDDSDPGIPDATGAH